MSHFTDRLENRKALQQALYDAKRLGGSPYYAGEIDGKLFAVTAAAISDYRKDHDLGTGAVIDGKLLRSLGLGQPLITEPGTLGNVIALPIINFVLNNALKGLPIMTILSGYKTYVIGAALIIVGGIALVGWSIPGVPLDQASGWPMILSGIGLITGRTGAKQDVAKAIGK